MYNLYVMYVCHVCGTVCIIIVKCVCSGSKNEGCQTIGNAIRRAVLCATETTCSTTVHIEINSRYSKTRRQLFTEQMTFSSLRYNIFPKPIVQRQGKSSGDNLIRILASRVGKEFMSGFIRWSACQTVHEPVKRCSSVWFDHPKDKDIQNAK